MTTVVEPTKAWKEAQAKRDLNNKGRFCIVADDYSCVVYLYLNQLNKPAALGYTGRSQKPSLYKFYGTENERQINVNEWIQEIKERKLKLQKDNFFRKLNEGDVISSFWGCEQSNVDFYLIIKLIGRQSVEIVEIGKIKTGITDMSYHCIPDINKSIGQPFKKQVSKVDGETIRISSFQRAMPHKYDVIDGRRVYKAVYCSSYG